MPENAAEAATEVVGNSFGPPRRELLFKVTVVQRSKDFSLLSSLLLLCISGS